MIMGIALVLLVSSQAGAAHEKPWIVVAASDNPLVMRGWLGQPDSFVTNLRITNPRQEAVQVRLDIPADLKLKDGDTQIRRDLVSLDRDVTLRQPDDSRNILVVWFVAIQ